ncbi:ECF transporter S component [Clostridium fermenticellae]|uniref:ECF transporter S component n=1 Tax=Clostridium fermenticellae TaxID=2068654 RepID=A0A386H394_9CLOT|nr:ECF transporter S component [Clostridium fermenticellae]AYD39955.1 ECF transporter S component [Clostridium fermenticellae]
MEKHLNSLVKFNTRQLAVIGMLSAISILLGITGLGFIPIPPVKATIMHVPVIIGAVLEGPVVGCMVGLIFGVFSIIQSITTPTPVSFAFINPLVSVLPRILIGITAYYSYKLCGMKFKHLGAGVAGFIGSCTNTIGVMGMVYIIYLKPYAKALNISVNAAKDGILTVCAINGIPEAILSVLITMAVVTAVSKIRNR